MLWSNNSFRSSHWWRVGQPQVSKSETVRKAYEALKVELAKARQY